jgi:cytochrome c-type biogenesis protein CcmH/NrfF
MRMEIARFVQEGKSETQIIEGYVQLYGQRIVADYAPTPAWAQYVPWLLAVAGAAMLAWWIRRAVRQRPTSETQAG